MAVALARGLHIESRATSNSSVGIPRCSIRQAVSALILTGRSKPRWVSDRKSEAQSEPESGSDHRLGLRPFGPLRRRRFPKAPHCRSTRQPPWWHNSRRESGSIPDRDRQMWLLGILDWAWVWYAHNAQTRFQKIRQEQKGSPRTPTAGVPPSGDASAVSLAPASIQAIRLRRVHAPSPARMAVPARTIEEGSGTPIVAVNVTSENIERTRKPPTDVSTPE